MLQSPPPRNFFLFLNRGINLWSSIKDCDASHAGVRYPRLLQYYYSQITTRTSSTRSLSFVPRYESISKLWIPHSSTKIISCMKSIRLFRDSDHSIRYSSTIILFRSRYIVVPTPIQRIDLCRIVWMKRWTRSASSNTSVTAAAPNNRSQWWNRFAILVRYVRIPVLIVSVYSLGYQQGIIDCIKEPVGLQNQILNGILLSTGCTSIDDVSVIDDNNIKYHSFRRPDQVAIVGHKIITAARNIVETKLQDAMAKVKATLPNDISPENELQALSSDPDVQFYYNARLRINGEHVEHSMWQYIFMKSTTPNAFVTEVLPRKFFITTAMLQVATTPDELAVVLGHEISHLILGHISSTNKVETFLRTVEVLLLSMDPTAGLLSVFVIGTIFAARRFVSAAYSRDNESEADELGLQIAAAACYDTVAGCKVMYKMHQVSNGTSPLSTIGSKTPNVRETEILNVPSPSSSSSSSLARLMDTHPPSLDRYEQMLQRAQNGENYTKYVNCANISRRLFNVLWGTKVRDENDDKNETKK